MHGGEPRALITGITGQDGSYLAELLLERGYEVHGVVRRTSSPNTWRIDHLISAEADATAPFQLHLGDLADAGALTRLIDRIQPDEIYHLAAQSDVDASFKLPALTFDVTATGTVRVLEAAREAGVEAKICQATSSEMFGSSPPPQSELTEFRPRSPYAAAKLAAYWAAVTYREAYGMHVVNGILFNHESPRRGEVFVTRKIARAVARIRAGLDDRVRLGNLEARRDWGYAPDYMRALHLMISEPEPRDYVIATGEQHSVRDFLRLACECAGLDDPEGLVEIDPRYFRPLDVDSLRGDATKARRELGWEPTVGFRELVELMVRAEIRALDREPAQAEGRPSSL